MQYHQATAIVYGLRVPMSGEQLDLFVIGDNPSDESARESVRFRSAVITTGIQISTGPTGGSLQGIKTVLAVSPPVTVCMFRHPLDNHAAV
jgi:hypothetical protein